MGSKVVVAAGWAVDDVAAKTFADVFYKSMIDGSNFGDAVYQARKAVFEQHPDVNTWGAYQCYGDPQYTFDKEINPPSKRKHERPKTPNDFIVRINNLVKAAYYGHRQLGESTCLKQFEEHLNSK